MSATPLDKDDLDRLVGALESCANKLHQLGNVFNGPNFTDRYGDGPVCLGLAKYARAIADEMRRKCNQP